MSKFIDIMVLFDTVTIEKDYAKFRSASTSDKPYGIASNGYTYMVTQPSDVISGQASSNMFLCAHCGDTIRWRFTSLSGNTDQSAIIYEIKWINGGHVISNPKIMVSYPVIPIPDQTDPTTYITVDTDADVYLECKVHKTGKEKTRILFYVANKDPETAKFTVFGYYYWDASINVLMRSL